MGADRDGRAALLRRWSGPQPGTRRHCGTPLSQRTNRDQTQQQSPRRRRRRPSRIYRRERLQTPRRVPSEGLRPPRQCAPPPHQHIVPYQLGRHVRGEGSPARRTIRRCPCHPHDHARPSGLLGHAVPPTDRHHACRSSHAHDRRGALAANHLDHGHPNRGHDRPFGGRPNRPCPWGREPPGCVATCHDPARPNCPASADRRHVLASSVDGHHDRPSWEGHGNCDHAPSHVSRQENAVAAHANPWDPDRHFHPCAFCPFQRPLLGLRPACRSTHAEGAVGVEEVPCVEDLLDP
mmetsp:Transcript_19731/g.46131  ORF Transcript_19731/g.46131 Transcript_19731/m.46131 type:complete len:293 (+) Transcript_19731:3600-4478(+)